MRFPIVALAGGVITAVLSSLNLLAAIGLAVHGGVDVLLVVAMLGGVGLGGLALGVGAVRGQRRAALGAAGVNLASAGAITVGVLLAHGADRELAGVFAIPAGAAAFAGVLCLVGGLLGSPRSR